MDEALPTDMSEARRRASRRAAKPRAARIRLQVCVSPQEAQVIEDAAKSANMSVSAYLRAVGIGFQPTAAVDQDEAEKLNHLSSNLGRLGGLLKLWVSNGPRPERYSPSEFREAVNGLIDQVRANQRVMSGTSKRLMRAHTRVRRVRGERTEDGANA
ncbi:MAG: plasmid mobilization protein [Caulobacteraceae bacterium]